MEEVVLLGGGGHCLSVLDSLYGMNKYNGMIVVDPGLEVGSFILNSRVYGDDDTLSEIFQKGCKKAFISVGSIKSSVLRRELDKKIKDIGFELINVIDLSSVVSDYAEIDKGVFIGKKAVVNTGAKIGRNAIVNTSVSIDHECIIGEYTHVACGSILCGNVRIGNDSFVGAGTTIIEGINIGNNVIIGAGSVILRNVEDNEIVYGVVK